jgi:hypothetical protein
VADINVVKIITDCWLDTQDLPDVIDRNRPWLAGKVLAAKVYDLCPDCTTGRFDSNGITTVAGEKVTTCTHPNAPTIAKLVAIGAAWRRPAVADDIVTRLRERQRELELFWPDEDPPKTWVGEAADFIEAQQAEIERLKRTVKDRDEWNVHLSHTVSFLLLAVPRPFRMAVNRKAVRLLEEEARRG